MALEQAAEPRAEPLPPHSIEAEEAVLGSAFVDRDAVGQIASFLRPEDFYRERNGAVYRAMLALYDRREPVDYLTVVDELERAEKYEAVGGLAYLSSLLSVVPTSVHVEHYARIVERTAIMRRLIQAAGKIAQLGYQDNHDVDTVLERAEQILIAVAQRRATRDFQSLGEVLQEYLEQLEQMRQGERLKYGVPTGFIDLDKITGGLQRSDLIILAARPSLGKTSLALNIAANAALDARAKVAVFSLEMSKGQLAARLLSMQSGLDSTRLRTARLSEVETRKLGHALGVLSDASIYVDDTPSISIMELRSKARRLHLDLAPAGVDLVIVDYLQLATSGNRDNRVQEISEISRSLKALARELHVPVLALSQLSRAVESRTPHIPMLSDLRESGCLAAETSVYLPDEGVYRPIGELAGKCGFRVLALNTETWRLERRTVLDAFPTGRKPVYRLATRLGRSVRATANHQFLTVWGWRRLDGLVPGTRLALPRQLPGPSRATMTHAELGLLGHLIGDGCTLPRHVVQYTTNDPALAENVADLATEVFGDSVAPRIQQERNWYQVYLAAANRLTHGRRNPVAAWMDDLGVFGLRSHEKYIRLAHSDVYWDEILSIEPDGEAEVYDLTVEGLHDFVAGDIVVHNSIEQDADVVLFIYREDVYNKETERKGVADIHIAKHRNGPTGQVSLLFLDKNTKFVDFAPYAE